MTGGAEGLVGTPLAQVETPALVVDVPRLDRNLQRMRDALRARGVRLRPHVKTTKSVPIVRRALEAGGGITVSTLDEAEYFLAHGIADILYAVGLAPAKLPRVRRLIEAGARLTVTVDSREMAEELARFGVSAGMRIPAVIELDTDGHRSGVRPDEPRLLDIGRALQAGAELRGVMTHAGESYHCGSRESIAAMAEQERRGAVAAAERLRAAGLACPVVSVGSTPTALYGRSAEGLTEVRAGVYMFFDLFMAGAGVCAVDDVALSVLATVIGHQADKGWVITDAGWTALSGDRSTRNQAVDQGFGLVRRSDGGPLADDLVVRIANQEHGIVARRDDGPLDVARYPIGSQLRVLPNHACSMAASFAHYLASEDGATVSAVWPRLHGHGLYGALAGVAPEVSA